MTLSVPGGTTAPILSPSRTTVPTCTFATSPSRPATGDRTERFVISYVRPLDRRLGLRYLPCELGGLAFEPLQASPCGRSPWSAARLPVG